ncbi:type I restriction endonuclease subunit R [Oceanithermus sp.]
MSPTDRSEKGFEDIIEASLLTEGGYVRGRLEDFDREFGVDYPKLVEFLRATQPEELNRLNLGDDLSRRKFLQRLNSELAARGVVDVLRKGISHGPVSLKLYYGRPTPGNELAARLHGQNIFSVTRQLRYSLKNENAIDLVLFINGLPVVSMELKNRLTGQNYKHAIQQYQEDRDHRETLLRFKRMLVHFAVDDQLVYMTTRLAGKKTWFLPFNKGYNGGAGNPPNPGGFATGYLWREVLERESLGEIIENYAQVVKEEQEGRKFEKLIFPRYHQLDAVRKLLAEAQASGAGRRYLIQHSTGSGKSNSIAWLAHQLVSLKRDGSPVFDTVVVVTDRVVLDRQINQTIKQFAQVRGVVGHAEGSADLARMLAEGKKIVITTVQKFPFILDAIRGDFGARGFAVIIDEAHSSQGGKLMNKMAQVLKGLEIPEEADEEDLLNLLAEAKRLPENASFFAFTATPKNKTLEMFGERRQSGAEVTYRPFHVYSMRQAIEEGFILDVLAHYTPVKSYYQLVKKVEDDPKFDAKKAHKKLKRYVEQHEHAIRVKAEIMVDHFHRHVKGKIKGKARAMVVTSSVNKAIEYFYAFRAYLREIGSPFEAVVAFSGEREYRGELVSEARLNGFPESKTTEMFRSEPYRFLIVADKYQTGFDEPLLHTMYVDKPLSGIKAVQTLSRLNRAAPGKHDTFVLDFVNDEDAIREAFEPYYQGTVLVGETDPNRLHDLVRELAEAQVYGPEDVNRVVSLFLKDASREQLEPLLEGAVKRYWEDLDEHEQVAFKSRAKSFLRAYNFLASVLDYTMPEWEKLSIYLNLLVPKLPAPVEEDLSQGILDAIDMDSYRVEVKSEVSIGLPAKEGEVEPVPTSVRAGLQEPELEYLSEILREFNERFGNIDWNDEDKVRRFIFEEMPEKLRADEKVSNAFRQGDPQNARIELDNAVQRLVLEYMMDHTQLYKEFTSREDFRSFVVDKLFGLLSQEKIS